MSLEYSPSILLNFSEREMIGESPLSYRFGMFRLDVAERQFLHNDSPIPLTPKAFEVLTVLVSQSGHLVEKEELLEKVWAGSFVEEANIARIIHTLRKALSENENGAKFIETVARSGYRFVAKVTEERKPIVRESETGDNVISFEEDFPDTIDVDEPVETRDRVSVAEQPAGPKSQTRVVLFTVGFLTAISLIVLLSFNFQSAVSSGPGGVKSIAVLPLKPLTAENREPIYEFGIADSLILKLSLAKDLEVRPLSATRQYADIEQDAIAAGREQKVDYVLASNYQIADGKIRITSQLINVQSGQVEGSFKVEQENSTIFAVQDAVAANIGGSLLKKLNRVPNDLLAKRYTTNEEAYRLYLQGTALAEKQTQEEVRKAVEYFEQAVRLDPNYALAYAGLANAQAIAARNGSGDTHAQYLKTKAAIEKALAIDDNLAEAHSYLGEIKTIYEWDFPGAEREHKRALELNPNSSAAHRMYALLLGFLGRRDESIAEIKTAIDLEPASVMNHFNYGMILFFARRSDEAITEFERIVERDPEYYFAYNWLRHSYRLKGNDDKAFESLVQMRIIEGEDSDKINSWKTIYAKSGWRGIFGQLLEESKADEKKGKPNYNQLAWYSIELEQREQAFAYLEKAIGQRHWAMVTLNVNPRFDSLRGDLRFDDLVRRVGLK